MSCGEHSSSLVAATRPDGRHLVAGSNRAAHSTLRPTFGALADLDC
ncbi:hypothetical protein FB564_0994 [Salinispora arenicola]|uniref:Uncharacterized protein n=1 Tax=Salinispora arenicola TaxID=168697 RepID=A0A542XJ92_SALAC|nr:hypothetical protein FB564_0994 [Salinispora arenicola]